VTTSTPQVLLATFQLCPEGEPGGDLVAALAARGVEARWACWDDADVDWAAADLVATRSTWDYHRRLPDFLAWAGEVVASGATLLNAGLFAWNADKAYLLDLAERVPTVPTLLLDDAGLREGLADALARWGTVVVKPRTGAGGVGLVVVEAVDDPALEGLTAGPWIAQPLVASVRTTGERSLFVLAGRVVSQVDKLPATGEVRVHELYGGRSAEAAVDPELAARAVAAVAAAESLAPGAPRAAYARVDLIHHDGQWVVSEVELIEPGLYLDVAPANADRFAELVVAELARPTFRDAGEADVAAAVALVESAYRGDASRAGWTTEADLLAGQRTDPDGVRAVIDAPDSRLLLAERDGALVACCQLERRGATAYFGMFAVDPTIQGGGLGSVVIAEAERLARAEWGAVALEMTVLAQRSELIAYYERRGYARTGETSPFPYGDERFGIPQRDDLHFVHLRKPLA